MKYLLTILTLMFCLLNQVNAQVEPGAGKWKTWFIHSVKDHRLPSPPANQKEIQEVLSLQRNLTTQMTDTAWQQVLYWNAGAPGYRWRNMMNNLWRYDTSYNGILANMLLNTAIYDAIIAAWDSKYVFDRPHPFEVDKRIKLLIPHPGSPSYPCEHSVAAGVAATIISHFYPKLSDSVNKMARQAMRSRIQAGVAFPSDTQKGFELGKKIALKEIEHTKGFLPNMVWDGKMPEQKGSWKGKPLFPLAGKIKTILLDSGSQFRPGPPPDFARDMEELRNFKPNFRSMANAFHYASQSEDVLGQKIFEYTLHLNPPRAAGLYAIDAIATYDGFIACWDAKYAYWGTRPDQYDSSFKPVLFFSPPFPGYPSGHAMIGGVNAEIYSYFFPADRAYFMKRAIDGAESRFQGGIHFRTDNEVGLDMGRKVGLAIIEKLKKEMDGEMVRGPLGTSGGQNRIGNRQ
ncbi:MAG TPA: phosphatase PAP2 family protein [Flavisolibacter sp.]